jgi:alkylation response protein AidB-like acyl-CoA dehydrogenase
MTVGLLPVLKDEQAMLLDASTRFIDAEFPLPVVRKRADGADYADTAYRRTAAELGWFGLLADDEHGGGSVSGNGVLDAALIAAERGARLQPGPFVGHSVVVHALSTTPSRARDAVLAGLVRGSGWATWAFNPQNSCRLSESEGALCLNGTITVVADGDDCEHLLLSAYGPQGLAQVLVAGDAAGVRVRTLEGLDVTRHWSAIDFDDVRVEPEHIVGAPGAPTDALVARQSQVAAVLSAAEAVGAMHADFHLALQYAKDRIAFGRPIGSFQAVKHLLADTSLWLEMSQGIVAAAATALGTGAPDGPALAHAAKAFVAERGIELAHNCFQVFGGIGFTWEHDQHFFLRRLAADAASFGSAAWHRARLLDVEGVGR